MTQVPVSRASLTRPRTHSQEWECDKARRSLRTQQFSAIGELEPEPSGSDGAASAGYGLFAWWRSWHCSIEGCRIGLGSAGGASSRADFKMALSQSIKF